MAATSSVRRDSNAVDLYWISGSPPVWRVMLGLLIKGIPYRSRRLDTAKQEHKSPDYLVLNPRGQVPTLVHGATVVRESIVVLAYLDHAFDGPDLFGATPPEAARIWQQVMDFENNLRPSVTAIAQILLRGEAGHRGGELITAIATFQRELAETDRVLAGTPYLCRERPSAADCWLYPSIAWIERAIEVGRSPSPAALKATLAGFPSVLAWRARVEALDGFERTVPPHWKE